MHNSHFRHAKGGKATKANATKSSQMMLSLTWITNTGHATEPILSIFCKKKHGNAQVSSQQLKNLTKINIQ